MTNTKVPQIVNHVHLPANGNDGRKSATEKSPRTSASVPSFIASIDPSASEEIPASATSPVISLTGPRSIDTNSPIERTRKGREGGHEIGMVPQAQEHPDKRENTLRFAVTTH